MVPFYQSVLVVYMGWITAQQAFCFICHQRVGRTGVLMKGHDKGPCRVNFEVIASDSYHLRIS
jgi:hypothetical protein